MLKVAGEFIKDIDFSELEEATVTAIDRYVGEVASAAIGEWDRIARDRLKTSRGEYIKGLQDRESFKQTGRREYEISLVGFLPNAIESGMGPKDLKPGLLSGRKAKVSKEGFRYNTVPFRHFSSSNTAERTPDKRYATELKDIIRKTGLNKIQRGAGGRLTGKVKQIKGTAGVAVRKLKPYHATTPLSGLTRYQHQYKSGAVQGQLFTFRRVSESPQAKAAAAKRGVAWSQTWTHPGLPGVKILPDVAEWSENELRSGIVKILEGRAQ